jgi:hypothetical protein
VQFNPRASPSKPCALALSQEDPRPGRSRQAVVAEGAEVPRRWAIHADNEVCRHVARRLGAGATKPRLIGGCALAAGFLATGPIVQGLWGEALGLGALFSISQGVLSGRPCVQGQGAYVESILGPGPETKAK